MSITSLSAGTGPAGLALAGVVIYLAGEPGLGVLLFVASMALSLFWALRFK